ncbi:single-stranded-DNA-specific exonuclease RecJ [Sutcliffiella horikoshii]|uniref:single-stranded-DNA-specific exonuclease RecJ n=1 Tax=Sutcliffiella horikoshii TaxID=79883 RepID=UPI001EEE3550|nr:single-stranded-DNA-specific exonuclease RecJ [Sutcliffiella horikoshii]MCG1022232.1 single-stranded-DNA-specific exonuclease RecJ [Sutcliffiella horikoshii]
MLASKSRWNVNESNSEHVEQLAASLDIAPLIASLLINRGFDTIDTAREFLYTNEQEFHDPFLMEDMEKLVERVNQAIAKEEKILVFGDYDADGVSSTTVMVTALREVGALVGFYIPNRFTEGYGPNEKAFKQAKENGYSVIITVDTGISALHEAEVAKELGIDLIITDHHEPGPELPSAYAIIHPKKETCSYPFDDLAGVGVAYKVAHALLGKNPEHLLDVAAIGTIADLVPLVGENRLLASKGIKKMQQTTRVGLKALLQKCGVELHTVTEETVGFSIGPRINAVGRLDNADPAVHLLMTDDAEEAKMLAEEMESYNKERQQIVTGITEEAIRQVEEKYPPHENSFIIVEGHDWNAGVIGIVASRLVDRFYRPTIVLSLDEEKGLAKGSARSIVGFDLFENLSECRDILPHFGGHPMAAGMTLKMEDVQELRQRMNKKASEILSEEDYIPISEVDMECRVDEVTLETIEQLEMLAPFGVSNPKPKVLVKGVLPQQIRQIGNKSNHLKLVIEQEGSALDCVGFGFGEIYHHVSPGASLDVLGELSINEWNNFRKPQLFLKDIRVTDWQLFDIRSIKQLNQTLAGIDKEKLHILYFNERTLDDVMLQAELRPFATHINGDATPDITGKFVVILDIPAEEAWLSSLLEKAAPERIYASFYQKENHFFSTIPTREHFKWFYALLSKKGSFDLNKHAEDIAKHRGWSKETVDFISQVFFDLEFVTIDKGFIALNHAAKKRDFEESPTYRKKQQQVMLENLFLYSSYKQLKAWFDQHLTKQCTVHS